MPINKTLTVLLPAEVLDKVDEHAPEAAA